MTDIEKNNLTRQNAKLQEDLESTKSALHENRAALINAQLTIQALVEQCSELANMVKSGVADVAVIDGLEPALNQIHDTSWLSELRIDAFRRGFVEGYRYALTKDKTLKTDDEIWLHYKERTASIWPSTHKYSLVSWRRKPVEPELVRFNYNESSEDQFIYDEAGQFMEFSVYSDLRLKYDAMQEELAGYKWILHDPLSPRLIDGYDRDACRKKLRKPQKDGILKIQYGQNCGSRDLFVLYGKGVPRCDTALVMNAFSLSRMHFDYGKRMPSFDPSLVEEFALRGYDLSTLKFSICKKSTEQK